MTRMEADPRSKSANKTKNAQHGDEKERKLMKELSRKIDICESNLDYWLRDVEAFEDCVKRKRNADMHTLEIILRKLTIMREQQEIGLKSEIGLVHIKNDEYDEFCDCFRCSVLIQLGGNIEESALQQSA